MSILIDANSRIIVQGITGRRGRFHSERMLNNNSPIVGGTSPGKGGEWVFNGRIPVFDTVKDCVEATDADVSVLFVPPHATADCILESIESGIKTIISVTGSVPVQDMMQVKSALRKSDSVLIGPNSPGILVPGIANAGIFPDHIVGPGDVALVSRSGTLSYEVLDILNKAGIGVSVAVGIGDDPIIGMDFKFCLELLEADPHTEQIVLVGGPGGDSELTAATYIMESITKPVLAYVVGENLTGSMMSPFSSRNSYFFLNSVERKTNAFIDAGALLARKIEDIPCLLRR